MNTGNENKSAAAGMSEIVKTVCRFIAGFIFLFGLYITAYGHLTPGGGFAGGVIIAASFILIMLSYGKEKIINILPRKKSEMLESAGALIFLFTAWAAIYAGGSFCANFIFKKWGAMDFRLMSGGFIPLLNFAIALKVMAGLFLVFFVLSITRVILEGEKLKMVKKQ